MPKKEIPIIVTIPSAIDILKEYQSWRRAEGKYDELGVEMPYSPMIIGLAIDKAIESMERMADLKISCELLIEETKV